MKTTTEQYRLATTEEIEAAANNIGSRQQKYRRVIEHVKKYFPENACVAVLHIDSEYNDSTYDNRIKYLVVYDKDYNELVPIKDKAKECRDEWEDLYFDNETNDHIDNIVVNVAQPTPLYVKL